MDTLFDIFFWFVGGVIFLSTIFIVLANSNKSNVKKPKAKPVHINTMSKKARVNCDVVAEYPNEVSDIYLPVKKGDLLNDLSVKWDEKNMDWYEEVRMMIIARRKLSK